MPEDLITDVAEDLSTGYFPSKAEIESALTAPIDAGEKFRLLLDRLEGLIEPLTQLSELVNALSKSAPKTTIPPKQ